MIRLLLIGPLPPPMGGATRHFLTVVEDLAERDDFDVTTVNTSRGGRHLSWMLNLSTGLRTIGTVLSRIRSADVVSFHASNRGMFLFGPGIVALCRLAGRPAMLRIFGGSFGDYYAGRGAFGRLLIRRFILSADAILLQTHRAITQLTNVATGELVWFSTYVRPPEQAQGHATPVEAGRSCRRFVFLGHLWRAKGLETILEAADSLPEGTSIDVFGPLDEYTAEDVAARGRGRVRYGGLLTREEVDARLWEYDCLVLPTFHASEGYPAALAEAFAHGLPVITTRWLAIPEIVDESCGILIEPGDTRAFVDSIERLHRDRTLWLALKAGARARASRFDHARWSMRFEEICEQLARA